MHCEAIISKLQKCGLYQMVLENVKTKLIFDTFQKTCMHSGSVYGHFSLNYSYSKNYYFFMFINGTIYI